MNLLEKPWMPVRRRNGLRDLVRPAQLADVDIRSFDAPRPDFNGALAQFAIGLLQTTTPADSPREWRDLYRTPPSAEALDTWFHPVSEAFEFDGDGARFMQDYSLTPTDGALTDVAALLIDSPGENAIKNNGDHFVKRKRIVGMCSDCAATALLTLQINAPAGGAGHRTGLRGGGPLSTLVIPDKSDAEGLSLWHVLWLNVMDRSVFLGHCGDARKTDVHLSFPWLAPIERIQSANGQTSPAQIHPAHLYWAMPRRIRFDLSTSQPGTCDVCARPAANIIRQFVTKNQGLNYKGAWNHPLSPYYEHQGEWLPLHPQPGGLGYRHWLGWVMGVGSANRKVRPARIVEHVLAHRQRLLNNTLRLWAFGYDMDKMKARCWYEGTLPLYELSDCSSADQAAIQSEVALWLSGAETAALLLRSAVKEAWFGGNARGDFSAVDAAFWSRTEGEFFGHLRRRIEAARNGAAFDDFGTRSVWHQYLSHTVLRLFDEDFVGAGPIERQHPRRAAEAFRRLRANLGGSKVRQSFGLPAVSRTSDAPGRATSNQEV